LVNRPIMPYEGLIAETVYYPGHNGDTISGYYARPLGDGPFPGVVLIMEIFGLLTHTKELARKFAAAGYITIAPDLYSREHFLDPTEARSAIMAKGGLADAVAIGDMEASARFLLDSPQSNGKIGSIGHCSGGRHSLLFACNSRSLSAAVVCYGGRVVVSPQDLSPAMPVAVVDMVERLDCPMLGLFGEADQNPNPQHVARLEEELKKHNKTYEIKSYPAPVGHGFFADYRPSYNQEAAVDGWERIFAFYGKYLAS